MCVDVNVSLPTVNKFLMLYGLRAGCVVIFIWTAMRTMACSLFVTIAIPEVFLGGQFTNYYLLVKGSVSPDGAEYYIYAVFIIFLLNEATLFAYAVYNLASGVYDQTSEPTRQFLVCRFFTWLIELVVLFTLCLIHRKLIGWYLITLMIVILEFYGFIIVYSYYRDLIEDESVCERIKRWNE